MWIKTEESIKKERLKKKSKKEKTSYKLAWVEEVSKPDWTVKFEGFLGLEFIKDS